MGVSLSGVEQPTGEPVALPTTFHAAHVGDDDAYALAVTTRGTGAATLSRVSVKHSDKQKRAAILRDFLRTVGTGLAQGEPFTVQPDAMPDGVSVRATGRLTDWGAALAVGVVEV